MQRVWVNNIGSDTGQVSPLGLITEFVCAARVNRSVPTLSEWGLIAMAGILGIVGLLAIHRRKLVA